MSERRGAVRIGPISLFTLVAVVCLAVMSVLVVTTSRAMYTMAQLQASSTTDGYAAESAAQEFLSGVDAALASSHAGGKSAAISAVGSALPSLESQAQAEGVTTSAETTTDGITATFSTSEGRKLEVVLSVGDDARYKISKWKLTAEQNDDGTGETLWSGTSN
jgi:hypothetical protein